MRKRLLMTLLLITCMLSLSITLLRARDAESTLMGLHTDETHLEGNDIEEAVTSQNMHLSEAESQTGKECTTENVEAESDGKFPISHRSHSDFTHEDDFPYVTLVDSYLVLDCAVTNGEVARTQMLEEDKVPISSTDYPL